MCVLLLLLLYLRERVLRQCGSVWHTYKALHEYTVRSVDVVVVIAVVIVIVGYREAADVLEMLTKMLL